MSPGAFDPAERETAMENQELRSKKEALGLSDFQINYKTGVHLSVIEAFFSGRSDELSPRDRRRLEELIRAAEKKR